MVSHQLQIWRKRKEAAVLEKSWDGLVHNVHPGCEEDASDDDGAAEVDDVHNGLHRISAHHESTITSTH